MGADIEEKQTILIAEDDTDDQLLIKDAFFEAGSKSKLVFVKDGVELLDYLDQEGEYRDCAKYPKPDLIIVDLNMPRLDGRQALVKIKSNTKIRHIPLVVLTTSNDEIDISFSYQEGANSYIVKPSLFADLVQKMKMLQYYWFYLVNLPRVI